MNAFTTFPAHRRISTVLGAGALLLLTACGGNNDEATGQHALASVEAGQAAPQSREAPSAQLPEVDILPVEDATGAAPTGAEELFKANSEMAFGTVPQPAGAHAAPDTPHAEPQ